MKDSNWKCKRSGDCCRYIADEDEWTHAVLTKEQRSAIEERMEPVDKGCKALVMRDNVWTCLGQELFGLSGKPENCSKFIQRCEIALKIKELKRRRLEKHN